MKSWSSVIARQLSHPLQTKTESRHRSVHAKTGAFVSLSEWEQRELVEMVRVGVKSEC